MRGLSMLAATVLAATASASALFPNTSPKQVRATPTVCNGEAVYCGRKYSNVSFIGAHDSGFVGSILDPRVNQELNITQQLDAGIRMTEVQVHVQNGVISLCHTSCLELYAGPLSTYLAAIKSWLDANPDEVVTLLISNGDDSNATSFASLYNQTGLTEYAFVPSTSPSPLAIAQWPTYAELIEQNTRLVTFMDYEADESVVPYILAQYNYFSQTPYDTTNASFPCNDLSPALNSDGLNRMYLINHFLDTNLLDLGIDIPDNSADYSTNAATGNGSIGAQVAACTAEWGFEPLFALVDFFDRGNVFAAQDAMNGISG